jgi:hypothetical protein
VSELFAVEPVNPGPKADSWPCLAGNALYAGKQAWIRVLASEDWEWGCLRIEFDCDGPPTNHWLAYVLDGVGNLSEALGLSLNGLFLNEVEEFILREGIAPNQSFWLRLTYSFWQDSWTNECDDEVDYKVVGITSVDPEQAKLEWEALCGRKMMLLR